MEDAYNVCNVIEIFPSRKVTKIEIGKPYVHFKLQMALTQLCKTHLLAYVNIQITRLLRGGIDRGDVPIIYVLWEKIPCWLLKI